MDISEWKYKVAIYNSYQQGETFNISSILRKIFVGTSADGKRKIKFYLQGIITI